MAANSAPCLDCYYCKRGLENLCEDLLFNNGAYAEYIRIPARIVKRNMYEIPAHVSYQDAALIEPLACVIRGLEETHVAQAITLRSSAWAHRFDVCPAGEDLRGSCNRARTPLTQLERAARMGAEELLKRVQSPTSYRLSRN